MVGYHIPPDIQTATSSPLGINSMSTPGRKYTITYLQVVLTKESDGYMAKPT